jgi:hypothetical protein
MTICLKSLNWRLRNWRHLKGIDRGEATVSIWKEAAPLRLGLRLLKRSFEKVSASLALLDQLALRRETFLILNNKVWALEAWCLLNTDLFLFEECLSLHTTADRSLLSAESFTNFIFRSTLKEPTEDFLPALRLVGLFFGFLKNRNPLLASLSDTYRDWPCWNLRLTPWNLLFFYNVHFFS